MSNLSFAQKKNQVYFSLGPSIGAYTYQGDLAETFSVQSTNLAFGAVGNLHFDSHLYARLQVAHGWVQAADSNSSDQQKKFRNLSFRSPITEISMQLVYDFFGVTRSIRYRPKYTPYVYAGVGIFSYNPQAKALNSKGEEQWFDLQPLGTEGQYLINGAGSFPKPYALTQVMIPFGVGMKFKLTEKLNLSVETGARK
ncbi:MAG: DUF6089 family protein, partial [Bacteroidia bacterium]|nr:DUF6089 family protein [Bacteroidia bacterium]